MRFILTILIWIVFVGGLRVYIWQRDAGLPTGPATVQAVEIVDGNFTLELTPTFSVEKDPFALALEDQADTALALNLNGVKIDVPAAIFSRGDTISINDLPEFHPGFNEIHLKASPPISESLLSHGIRVRLLDGERPIADETLWGSSGSLVSGSVTFDLTPPEDDDHDR